MTSFSVNSRPAVATDPPPAHSERWEAWRPISSIMRLNTPRIAEGSSRATLVALFRGRDVSEIIVVDTEGKPIGLVSRGNLCCEGSTARSLMEPAAFTFNDTIPISLAAALMASAGASRVPVVSATNGIVGLLTCREILTWIARQAGHRVLESESGAEPGSEETE